MENLEQPIPSVPSTPTVQTMPKPRRGRGWRLAWGILLVLLVADVAGGSWLYLEYKKVKEEKAGLEQEVANLKAASVPASSDVEEVVWYTEGFDDDYCVLVDLGQGDVPPTAQLEAVDAAMESLFGDKREAFRTWINSDSMKHELQTSYKHCLMGEYGFTIKRTLNFSKNEYSLYAARFDEAQDRFWGANGTSGWTFQAAWEESAQQPTMFYDDGGGHKFMYLTYGTESTDSADPITLTRRISLDGAETIAAPLVSVCQYEDSRTRNCLYTHDFE